MQLKKKLLTVLSITTVGISTPIAISGCSCSNPVTLTYGEAVNCKDSKEKGYHSISNIKSAASNHIQVLEEKEIASSDLIQFSNDPEFFYWDLVYSVANDNVAFTLEWNFENNDTRAKFKDGKYNDDEFTALSYVWKDGSVWIKNSTKSTEIVKSYCYHSVTVKTDK